jgi:hypothetical protein
LPTNNVLFFKLKIFQVSGRAFEKNFTDIMKHYRTQPQAASHVYRSVLLKPRQPPPPPTAAAPESAPADADTATTSTAGVEVGMPPVSSQSLASLSAFSQAPPTPTRMANRSTVGEDGSERGDIICFYNTGSAHMTKERIEEIL